MFTDFKSMISKSKEYGIRIYLLTFLESMYVLFLLYDLLETEL